MTEAQTNLLQQRRHKLATLKERGLDPYPHKFAYSHTISDVRQQYDTADAQTLQQTKPSVRICGRIRSLRPQGKAGFMDLSDGEQRLQVYVRRDAVGEENFELFRLFDIGDIVAAEGTVFRTRTNELTLLAGQVFHLAKNLLPLPEKWHGLTDIETRLRQRYVDLIVNPEVRDVFVKRSRIVKEIRAFLDGRGYLEVETPVLHSLAGGGAGPALSHASQRSRHGALPADCAGASPQAPHCRRHPARL